MKCRYALVHGRLGGRRPFPFGALDFAERDPVRLSLLEHDGIEPGCTGERLVVSLIQFREFDGLLPVEEGETRDVHGGVRARRSRCRGV